MRFCSPGVFNRYDSYFAPCRFVSSFVEQFGLARILPHFLTSLGERPLLPGVSVDVSSRYGTSCPEIQS
jgi:hypothetical protein